MGRVDIALAAQAACCLEVSAPKVGNVNRYHDFPDCSLEDFLLSGAAIAFVLAGIESYSVGRAVLACVEAARAWVPVNTNLGIVLLLAPLARAWAELTPAGKIPGGFRGGLEVPEPLRRKLARVLAGLGVEDAGHVYRAIRLASPGGLGKVEAHDVSETDRPEITLLEAMKLAADRDLVAREYVNCFSLTLDEAVPALGRALEGGLSLPEAVADAHLYLLARVRDTLIIRKRGIEASREVSRRAQEAYEAGGWKTPRGRELAARLDRWLRGDSGIGALNPGSTADIITAALFVAFLLQGPGWWKEVRPGMRRGRPRG